FYWANELRGEGFSEAEVAEASALRRQVWAYLASGAGYEQAKSAIDRAKPKRWFDTLRAQHDDLIGSFADAKKARAGDWFKTEMNYDPVATLRKLTAPALFLFGGDDQLVPVPRSVEIIRQTLTRSGHRDFTIKIFPGADHQLYAGGVLAPGYEETMKEWVRRRVN
ncbi:MAG TPA: dienelactone hydrolase family protein, partial [Bryobacteraceae bacterium]|nr:dienelactone hydrolase family protein [Bryobacteraceae bacterium]